MNKTLCMFTEANDQRQNTKEKFRESHTSVQATFEAVYRLCASNRDIIIQKPLRKHLEVEVKLELESRQILLTISVEIS